MKRQEKHGAQKMPGRLSNRILNVLSIMTCVVLAVFSWTEWHTGDLGIAVLLLVGMASAAGLAWLTRRPFDPRVSYQQEPGSRRRRAGRRSA
ncbi:MAG: hypothetical protein HKN58_04830 [Xanthomonadales bacterium]|nr:hypothetical protein [Xanthomonadales bacterium]